MVEVGVAELQAGFGELLETARSGEAVVIRDGGKPVARLTPLAQAEPHEVSSAPVPDSSAWKPTGDDPADRARQIREHFDMGLPPMTEEEFQAEMDIIRGRV